ncbi:hypothetical protein [Amycolatopsis silviterrae]|uniref:Uncharacterized protein n=1 Tax=Amycolatopsis silviterrae TaxID=1656914 RepID=A0ABW5H8P7_9PSEU
MVAPVLEIQGRLNYQTFLLMTTGEHGAHRQCWAAGLELDDDEEPPIGPDRLLHSDSPETRFGTFDSTDMSGYVSQRPLRESGAVKVALTDGEWLGLGADAAYCQCA